MLSNPTSPLSGTEIDYTIYTSVNCHFLLYADDSVHFTFGKYPRVISEILSEELDADNG